MTEDAVKESNRKERMRQLRAQRKETIAAVAARVKEQKRAMVLLRGMLSGVEEGRTVPELAESSGMPASEVLWYISALKKYGEVLEGKKDSGFFRYTLAPSSTGEPPQA